MQIKTFDHIGIVVRSLPDATALFLGTMGGEFVHGGDEDARGMRTIQLRIGGAKIELLQPLSEHCHLTRFIDRFGEGVHHMTMIVPEIHAAAQALIADGYEVVDLDDSDPEWREVYIRPSSGFGALIQLAETTRDWLTPHTHYTLQDVLDGAMAWSGQDIVRRTPEMGPPVDRRPDWRPGAP